jgi:hypothetical protein
MLRDEYFLARFGAYQQRLDALGLVNRGFCPICGASPIGPNWFRTDHVSGVKEYICEDCEKRINPFKQPSHRAAVRRRWGCGIAVALVAIAFLALRTCR